MTMRLSDSSLAGTARTDVAVGTDSELSMFVTTRAAAPLSGRGRAGRRRRGVGAARRPRGRGSVPRRPSAAGGAAGAAFARRRRVRQRRRSAAARRALAAAAAAGAGAGAAGRGTVAPPPARVRGAGAAGRAVVGAVVGQELAPGLRDAVGVLQVLLVDLVHQPLVGPEVRLLSRLRRHAAVRLFPSVSPLAARGSRLLVAARPRRAAATAQFDSSRRLIERTVSCVCALRLRRRGGRLADCRGRRRRRVVAAVVDGGRASGGAGVGCGHASCPPLPRHRWRRTPRGRPRRGAHG